MADGAGKIAAQKEVAQAQEALLGGKIGACAMHLSRAMHAGTMNQARPKPQPKPRSNPDGNRNRSNLRCKPGKTADCVAHRPFRPQMRERFCGRCGAERCQTAFRCVEPALVLTA